jgi:predicted metal-binding protein
VCLRPIGAAALLRLGLIHQQHLHLSGAAVLWGVHPAIYSLLECHMPQAAATYLGRGVLPPRAVVALPAPLPPARQSFLAMPACGVHIPRGFNRWSSIQLQRVKHGGQQCHLDVASRSSNQFLQWSGLCIRVHAVSGPASSFTCRVRPCIIMWFILGGGCMGRLLKCTQRLTPVSKGRMVVHFAAIPLNEHPLAIHVCCSQSVFCIDPRRMAAMHACLPCHHPAVHAVAVQYR